MHHNVCGYVLDSRWKISKSVLDSRWKMSKSSFSTDVAFWYLFLPLLHLPWKSFHFNSPIFALYYVLFFLLIYCQIFLWFALYSCATLPVPAVLVWLFHFLLWMNEWKTGWELSRGGSWTPSFIINPNPQLMLLEVPPGGRA